MELSHTGDSICSDVTGKSSKPLHAGNGICANASGNGFCYVPGAAGDGIL